MSGELARQADVVSWSSAEEELAWYRRWVAEAADVCESAAQGDLEPRLLHAPKTGDIGRLLHSINHMLDMTDAFVRESGATLDHAARGQFFRRVLLRGMRGSFKQASQRINKATEEMSHQAKALGDSESRRRSLAQKLNEMIVTLAEAARDAAHQATEADPVMQDLTTMSHRVGSVVKAISQIANQTRLLALNASIEAARAGNFGKGFGVVAAEVKQLARETAQATEEISSEIARVQSVTGQVTDALHGISKQIGSIDTIAATISESVQEDRGWADHVPQGSRS
jgi:methyl-accepting chemotaxis protein